MVRLIGAVLVAAGGAWVGFQAAAGVRSQVWAVRHMAEGVAALERELELNAPPLPQLLARAAAHSEGPAQRLFQGCLWGMDHLEQERFAALWRRLVPECAGLNREGQEILLPLGDILGRYDTGEQREGLSAIRRRLEKLAARLEADCRRQGRVYQALGLSGGAFLVILLL